MNIRIGPHEIGNRKRIRSMFGSPILLENLIEMTKDVHVQIDNRWYRARAENWKFGRLKRIYHAWLVLIGRAHAFQFKQDRIK